MFQKVQVGKKRRINVGQTLKLKPIEIEIQIHCYFEIRVSTNLLPLPIE
jgi:hypothetical protein